MEDNQDFSEKNDVILQLIKQILEMTDGERLDLLEQLGKVPVKELSLGDRDGFRRMYDQTITFSTQDRQYQGPLQGYQQWRHLHTNLGNIPVRAAGNPRHPVQSWKGVHKGSG